MQLPSIGISGGDEYWRYEFGNRSQLARFVLYDLQSREQGYSACKDLGGEYAGPKRNRWSRIKKNVETVGFRQPTKGSEVNF